MFYSEVAQRLDAAEHACVQRQSVNITPMYKSGWLSGDEGRNRGKKGKKMRRLCCPMMKGLID